MSCLCRSANASEISTSASVFIRHLDCSWGKLVSRNFVNTAPAYVLMLMFLCFHLLMLMLICASENQPCWLHVFSPLTPAACFPALDSGCMFSRPWLRLHVFPPLTPTACLRLHVFPPLTPAACFPAWHRLHDFHALDSDWMFPAFGCVICVARA